MKKPLVTAAVKQYRGIALFDCQTMPMAYAVGNIDGPGTAASGAEIENAWFDPYTRVAGISTVRNINGSAAAMSFAKTEQPASKCRERQEAKHRDAEDNGNGFFHV